MIATTFLLGVTALTAIAQAKPVRFDARDTDASTAATYKAQAQAAVTNLPSGWSAIGCYSDSWTRALNGTGQYDNSLTYASCISWCSNQGYTYAGVEGAHECYCGNGIAVSTDGGSIEPYSDCSYACYGDSTEQCGGYWRANIFTSAAQSSSSSASAAASSTSSYTPSSTSAASSTSSAASTSTSTSASSSAASSSTSTANASAAASSSSAAAAAASSAAALASASAIPTGWTESVCIAEGSTSRALKSASTTSSSMTYNKCVSYCSNAGYTIAGVEYGTECYCGDILSGGASLSKTSTACTMSCGGTSLVKCGGPNALTLFVSDTATSTLSSDLTSKTITLPSGWSAASTTCVAEGSSGRALALASTSSSQMTVPTCLNWCASKGYQYAGLEYSSECYCGDSLLNGASLSKSSSNCNMACSGDDATTCGGSSALQLYVNPSLALTLTTVNSFSYQGCIQEVSGRALTSASFSASNMTISSCVAYCSAKGYTNAGMEYSSECYCGNALKNGASLTSVSTQCNMACSGNAAQICGGPNAITLYASS